MLPICVDAVRVWLPGTSWRPSAERVIFTLLPTRLAVETEKIELFLMSRREVLIGTSAD